MDNQLIDDFTIPAETLRRLDATMAAAMTGLEDFLGIDMSDEEDPE